jgi:hypothetical protein
VNKNKLSFKKIRRFLFSIHISQDEWLIQVLGIQIKKNYPDNRAAFFKINLK